MTEYYIVINKQQQGPFNVEKLKNQKIKRDTLIWYEGLENWVKAEQIEELKEFLKIIPPPIPEVKSDEAQDYSVNLNVIKNKVQTYKKDLQPLKSKFANEVIINLKFYKWALLIMFIAYLFFAIKTDYIINDGLPNKFNYEELMNYDNKIASLIDNYSDQTNTITNKYREIDKKDNRYIYHTYEFGKEIPYFGFIEIENIINAVYCFVLGYFSIIIVRYLYYLFLWIVLWIKKNATIK